MRPLRRLWQYLDIVEMEMPTGKAQPLIGPGAQDDLDRLAKPRRALLGRHSKRRKFNPRKAASGAPIDPSAGQQVEQRDLLGKP